MADSLPSSIGEPIAESTFLHRDETPVLQISVNELFQIFSLILSKYVIHAKRKKRLFNSKMRL